MYDLFFSRSMLCYGFYCHNFHYDRFRETQGRMHVSYSIVGFKAPVQADTSMEPNVMGDAPTQTLVSPIIPLSAISPSINFVTNQATLPSHVLNFIPRMSLSIVLPLLQEMIKIGYLIRLLLIIPRVIFPIYPFIPNMMELMK